MVETVRGIEFGKVVITNRQVDEEDVVLPLKKVIRLADEEDKRTVMENQDLADKAIEIGSQKLRNMNWI